MINKTPDAVPKPPAKPRNAHPRPSRTAPVPGRDVILNGMLLTEVDLAGMDSDYAEASGSTFVDLPMSSSGWRHAAIADCTFTGCDLANAQFVESGWQRVEIRHSRLLGAQFAGCSWKNVRISDTMINLANLRFLDAQRIRFENCTLTGTDFGSAQLTDVSFVDCDLTEAEFSNARMTRVRLERCRLARIGGVGGLSGAVVDAADLLQLAESLAAAHGIRVAPSDAQSEPYGMGASAADRSRE